MPYSRYTYYNTLTKGQWSDLLHAQGEQNFTSKMMMNRVRKYMTTISQGLNPGIWVSAQSDPPTPYLPGYVAVFGTWPPGIITLLSTP